MIDGINIKKRNSNSKYNKPLHRLLAELPRARDGAPWVRKFGKLSIRENLVMT